MPQLNDTARQAPRPGNYRPIVDHSNNMPRQENASNGNAHVGWIIGVLIVLLVLSVGYIAANNKSKASDPVKSVAPVVESKTPATVEMPAPTTGKSKASTNKGKSNNINIEGNENNVHIGEKHYHNHKTVERTTTVVVERPVTVVRERVVVVPYDTGIAPPVRVDRCEELRIQHETTVALWKAGMGVK